MKQERICMVCAMLMHVRFETKESLAAARIHYIAQWKYHSDINNSIMSGWNLFFSSHFFPISSIKISIILQVFFLLSQFFHLSRFVFFIPIQSGLKCGPRWKQACDMLNWNIERKKARFAKFECVFLSLFIGQSQGNDL